MNEYEDDLDAQTYDPSPAEALLREKPLKQLAIARYCRRLAEIDRQLERLMRQEPAE